MRYPFEFNLVDDARGMMTRMRLLLTCGKDRGRRKKIEKHTAAVAKYYRPACPRSSGASTDRIIDPLAGRNARFSPQGVREGTCPDRGWHPGSHPRPHRSRSSRRTTATRPTPGRHRRRHPTRRRGRPAAARHRNDCKAWAESGAKEPSHNADLGGRRLPRHRAADAAPLCQVEVLPGDVWGRVAQVHEGRMPAAFDNLIDVISSVCARGDTTDLARLFSTPALGVPRHMLS